MANGEMLAELRELLQGETAINQKTATRLTLAALAEVLTKVDRIEQNQSARIAELELRLIGKIEKLEGNPAVRVGGFTKAHKKTTGILGVLFFFIANAWFVSGWRKPIMQGVLSLLGAPKEWIDLVP